MGCTSTKMHESGPQGLVSCSRHSLWDALQLKCMSLDLKDWCLVADIHYGMHFNYESGPGLVSCSMHYGMHFN